jgi:hypothetical protein
MINITTGHSLIANIETSSARSPNNFMCDIMYDDLTVGEKAIYDDGFGVLVIDTMCNVDNAPYELQINRMTSQPVNEADASLFEEITKTTMDYNSLSAADKTKLDLLNQLYIDKCW